MPDPTHPSGKASTEDSGQLIDFPREQGSGPPPKNNLPLQLTSFMDRERDRRANRGLGRWYTPAHRGGWLWQDASGPGAIQRGIPEWMADALNEYAKAHSEGYSDWTAEDFERLTGHSATHYEQFASDFEQIFR